MTTDRMQDSTRRDVNSTGARSGRYMVRNVAWLCWLLGNGTWFVWSTGVRWWLLLARAPRGGLFARTIQSIHVITYLQRLKLRYPLTRNGLLY